MKKKVESKSKIKVERFIITRTLTYDVNDFYDAKFYLLSQHASQLTCPDLSISDRSSEELG